MPVRSTRQGSGRGTHRYASLQAIIDMAIDQSNTARQCNCAIESLPNGYWLRGISILGVGEHV
jgi:hypothetical protein